jgi:plastocyanin domain-containing protein
MAINKIIVVAVGLVAIVFTYWFFLMRIRKTVYVSGSVDITVQGGYSPEVISVPRGRTTTLNFTRTDPNSCLEEVIMSDFKIRKELPLNQKVSINITPQKSGEFGYSCGMGMFHGKIIVK